MSQIALELLLKRRSVKPIMMTEPGPSPDQLDAILTAAARVPDHKALVPWRFIVFEGDARAAFGQVLASVLGRQENEPPSEVRLEIERQRLSAAPVTIAVVSRAHDVPGAPEW